jgi:hypothetical protein
MVEGWWWGMYCMRAKYALKAAEQIPWHHP